MFAILSAQLRLLKKNPLTMLLMVGLTVLFAVALGSNVQSKLVVDTYYDSSLDTADAEAWLTQLNRSEIFEFKWEDQEKADNRLIEGDTEFTLKLLPDDYRVMAAVDSANAQALDRYIRDIYQEELMVREAEASGGADIRSELERQLLSPVLKLSTSQVETKDDFKYDTKIQGLFGFSLFFVIFTIAYSVNGLLEEKKNGIWDRVILSPVSKTAMYIGHLLNSFIIGYVQIAIVFILFRYVFEFPIGDDFITLLVLIGVYTFAVVSMGMLMVGLVKTPQQMSVLTPIVAVSSAMIGGAYWPIEIVTNPILLALSKIVPVTYGMEALKGVTYYGYQWAELLQPMSYMLLFGVVCMGIGINLIERRSS